MTEFVTNNSTPHLGGNFKEIDIASWCPAVWEYILETFDIKTAMDVGAGAGHAAKWFHDKGIIVTAVEGLKDNVTDAVYPEVLHDLTTGPFINKVNFVNCIEVVEHIEEVFLENLLTTLCQGEYLLMTHAVPGQKGWHHVNCQNSEYWIDHLKDKGFVLLSDHTIKIQALAAAEGAIHVARNGMLFQKIV